MAVMPVMAHQRTLRTLRVVILGRGKAVIQQQHRASRHAFGQRPDPALLGRADFGAVGRGPRGPLHLAQLRPHGSHRPVERSIGRAGHPDKGAVVRQPHAHLVYLFARRADPDPSSNRTCRSGCRGVLHTST